MDGEKGAKRMMTQQERERSFLLPGKLKIRFIGSTCGPNKSLNPLFRWRRKDRFDEGV